MGSSTISLGLGLGGGKSATSSGSSGGGGAAYANLLSASFDGTDDFLNVNGLATHIVSMTDFSVSAWVKGTDTQGVFFRAAQSSTVHIGFYVWNNFLVTTIQGGGLTEGWDNGGVNISDGNWHHVVMTYTKTGTNASTALGYVDGNLRLTTNGSGTIQSGIDEAAIGRRPTGSGGGSINYGGLIDEVAIFDSVLSGSNVTTIYNSGVPADISDLSPVGWYRMGDGTGDNDSGGGAPANSDTIGTVVNQGSASSSNATGTNGPTYSSTVPS